MLRPVRVWMVLLGVIPTLAMAGCGEDSGGGGLSGVPDAGKRDIDCSDVEGPVSVTGGDRYDLDRDGDGVGCE